MKVLCVAEKPSISKAVAQILSGGRINTRNSKNKYVKNYDFSFNFTNLGQCDVTMTCVMGHILGLEFESGYEWGKCVPGRLFDARVIEQIDRKDLYQNIGDEAKKADVLMIWTDCDREGEFIGYEILQAASKTNNRMNMDNTLRAQFSHLERNHIVRAAKNPIKLHPNSVEAVKTRMELDLRTGATFTRFLTNLFKARFSKELSDQKLISYGSCQFPTLGFIVDRFNRYKNFVPENFWYLDLETKKDNVRTPFSWDKNRLFDRMVTTLIYQNCLDHERGEIISNASKPTSNYRPLPLTTVELQKNCSRFLKITAKQALDSAEKLYNKGFVSYPRTETDQFPKAMNLQELVTKQNQSPNWGEYANELVNGKFRQPRAGRHDDKAHPPIHPITFLSPTSTEFTAQDKRVYEYIVRHFLACCSDDAKGQQTTVKLRWGEESFTASGLVVLERNYLDVFPYHTWSTTKDLPSFAVGEQVMLFKTELKQGKTSPPTLMTEAELIALMDANGIGTDATIADHIVKVVDRNYACKTTQNRNTYFIPSELGLALIEGFEKIELDNISLSKPFLRKDFENHLDKITDGSRRKDEVIGEMLNMYKQAFATCNHKQGILVQTYKDIIEKNAQ